MKDKFEILNDVKMNIDDYEEVKFANNDDLKNKMRMKIRNRKYKDRKKMVVASIGILLGGVIITSEPSLAYIRNIGKQIEYFFDREENELKGYKVELNQVVSDKNIDIELKELMLGDGELLLSLKIDDRNLNHEALGLNPIEENWPELYEPKVQIGDMVFVETSGGSSGEVNDDNTRNVLLTCDLSNLDKDDDGKVDVQNFDLISNLDTNKNYDIKVSIDRVGYTLKENAKIPEEVDVKGVTGGGLNVDTGESFETRTGDIKGNWNFETTINANNIVKDIQIYEVNKEVNIKDKNTDIDVFIEEVRISPTKIKIKHKFKVNKDENTGPHPKFLGFIVRDENGQEVDLRSSIDLDASEELMNQVPYSETEISGDMKNIKITPIIEDRNKRFNSIKEFKNSIIYIETE